jgi:hypothetical protein
MTGTPADANPATTERTISSVNWWPLACEPSRSDESVIRTSSSDE